MNFEEKPGKISYFYLIRKYRVALTRESKVPEQDIKI